MDTPLNQNDEQISIPIKDTQPILCECGCEIFDEGLALRKVSALVSPTGKGGILPMRVFYCKKCFKRFEFPSIIS